MIEQIRERLAGFVVIDGDGTIVRENPRAVTMLRVEGSLVGRHIETVIPVFASDDDDDRISIARRDDGSEFPVFIAAVPFAEHVGIGIVDLTDPETIHDAFVPTNTVPGRLIAQLDVGIVVQGPDGRILAANAAAGRTLGLTMDELLGRTSVDPRWASVREDGSPFPGEQHPAMVCLRSGSPVTAIMGVLTPAGDQRWIDVHAIPLVTHEDRVIAVATSFVDISAEHLAANDVRASLERYEALVAEASDAVMITDRDGTITYAAPSTASTLGRTPRELGGSNILALVPSSEQDTLTRLLAQGASRPGARVTSTMNLAMPHDGVRWFEVRIRNFIESPAVGGLVVTMTDVHDRVSAVEQLRRVNEELERRLVERDEEHRVDRELGLASDLLSHCQTSSEAQSVVWGAINAVFLGREATLLRPEEGSSMLHCVEHTHNGAPDLAPDDCWATRTNRVHESTGVDGLSCRHVDPAVPTICIPLGMASRPFGVAVVQASGEAAVRHAHALADRLGPLLAPSDRLVTP